MGYTGNSPVYASGANIAIQFTAIGGTPPYSWAFSPETTVPAGLTIGASSGLTDGIVADGVYPIIVVASDTLGQVGVDALTLYVGSDPLGMPATIPTPCYPGAYSYQMAVTGGVAPVVFELFAGTLPLGLSLSSSGLISGTPTAVGDYSFTIRAVDSVFGVGVETYNVTVAACGTALALNADGQTFNACYGASFYYQLVASGGAAPYTYSLQGGGLPPSLLLSGDEILGVLTNSGTYDTTIRVVDNASTTVDFPATFVVGSALQLDVDGIFPVVPSVPYTQQLVIVGTQPGDGTITLDAAQLPPGLTYDSGTHTISGTTTVQTGIYPIVSTLDSGTCTNTYNFNLLVYKLQVEPFALCVLPNVEYYAKLSTLNGISPFTWELTGSALPDYLVLNPLTGEISGSAATESVTYTSVKVTDGLGNTASTDLTITVSTLCASNTEHRPGAPPTAPGRAAWIPSLQSALIIIGSNYFADNLIKYLPSMYGS